MPKRIIPLSDMKVQKAKAKGKNVTLFDGGGLFLMVTARPYRFITTGKRKTLGRHYRTEESPRTITRH